MKLIRSVQTINYLSFAIVLTACGGTDTPPAASAPETPIACANLNGLAIPANQIGLASNGASISSSEIVAASGTGSAALGAYCKVIGSIASIDKNAPPIQFQIHLPANWNKKIMMFGGGGYNGQPSAFVNTVHGAPVDQLSPQGRGYAVFGSDSGHAQKAPFIFGRDASFASNDEALNNFAGDALKKTHDAALYVINKHYLQAVQKAYFFGGSTGGREALLVAQKWPQDYDGIVSMFPAWNSAAMTLQFGRISRAFGQPGAYLNVAKRKLVYATAIANCDTLDGIQDGIISNVNACNAQFDPNTASVDGKGGAALRCADGSDLADTCLSDVQITALKVFDSAAKFQFTLASGETQYPGFNVWGSDLGIPSTIPALGLLQILGLNQLQPTNPVTPDMPYMTAFYDQWAKYFVSRDSNFNGLAMDPENPGTWAKRISDLSLLQDVNKTDLSALMNKGGKLLIAHGNADALVSTRASAQYYERLKATMGAANVDSFVRYYEIPGYGHGTGPAFNLGWDSITALENWVERGYVPVNQIATDKTGIPGRTRPLCAYPSWPKYIAGDANFASSFSCVTG